MLAACGDGATIRTRDSEALTPGSTGSNVTDDGGGSENSGAAPVQPEQDPNAAALPDLVLDAAYLIDTTTIDVVTIDDPCLLRSGCVTGLGERRVVRFGSRTGNIGTADLVLGKANEANPLWTWSECRESFELLGFARYALHDPVTGDVVVRGGKDGFCIADAEDWVEGGAASCEVYDCDYQGISRGCVDNYGAALQCQWVDITGIPAGAYELQVIINARRDIAELDYANNTVKAEIVIDEGGVTVAR
jgi:Lysyl oxidase